MRPANGVVQFRRGPHIPPFGANSLAGGTFWTNCAQDALRLEIIRNMRSSTRFRRRAAATFLAGTILIGGATAPASAAPNVPQLPSVPGLPGLPSADAGDGTGTGAGGDGGAEGGDASGSLGALGSSDDYPAIDEAFYDTSTVTAGAPGSILRTAAAAPSARATSAHPRSTGPWKTRQIPSRRGVWSTSRPSTTGSSPVRASASSSPTTSAWAPLACTRT